MAAIGSKVYASDYNAVQVKARIVLGDGYPYGYGTTFPEYGYGASLLSSPVDNTRELNTATVTTTATAGVFTLTLASVVGAKIGKIVKVNGVVSNSTITSINTVTSSVTINNTTTSIISTGSIVSIYYNSNILITKQQWQNLADDINKISLHQNNTNFVGYGTVTGKVTLSNLTLLNSTIDTLTLSKSAVDASQLTLDPFIGQQVVAYQWGSGNTGIRSTTNIVFSSAQEMQYFFNSGGEISFGGQGPPLVTSQDTAWYNLLNTVFVNTSARFTRTEFSRISGIPFLWYQVQDGTAPYNLNTISITAQKFSTIISFVVTFQDGHVASGLSPADFVSSGAGYKVYQKRSTGAFTGVQPSSITVSNFTIV